ncbi:hypothetical protein CHU92_15280 [Flavobacterium cyanobacteriorum]|uniref:Uncharacterized protein n=1 Tax=Flavobacterium cyanobacteriorum TaxID=2022802 RepID=A0A255YT91_9FLAO|nr:hypothetical protein [Flavobacterium cyanobacteriorum]OYQ31855.1 hypothetical protein CHU92_15280 [Flavobacterium cyanobacteriorum]
MKKLLTMLLLTIGAAAFAHEKDNLEPAASEKNTTTVNATAKKVTVKAPATAEAKPKAPATRAVCTSCSGDARFNVSGYFAEFVNRNNLKIVKLLLE